MSAVLCLPACLCVSAAAYRGQVPHENASLAALSVRAITSGAAVSSSSAAPSHTRTSGTAPRPHEPSAAPHTATLISSQSVRP